VFTIRRINSTAMNNWLTDVHYLHRPIIKSKLLAHAVYADSRMVGGLLWATPHFTKKRDLFGMPGTLDKWEVLMLARFYLIPDSGLLASAVLSASIGKAGKNATSNRRRGWLLQQDWVTANPPINVNMPYVPRLLISWSDDALETIECCPKCEQKHEGQHKGIIYQASGWERWDVSGSSGASTGRSRWREEDKHIATGGRKICWIMRLAENRTATMLPLQGAKQQSLFDDIAA
jgi:hypothetical protein